ncbi:hypothetical protein J2TS4_37530 [Paenibacillus sp. J2TS4]|nr:hypothetical protein J2TS4_37530 [Paenibacillus sp. J2TS4]
MLAIVGSTTTKWFLTALLNNNSSITLGRVKRSVRDSTDPFVKMAVNTSFL